MLFCTQEFLFFFVIVFAVYWALPWQRLRVWLLLVASYYFYASWSPRLAFLIFVTATLDYLIARTLDRVTASHWRRGLLALSLSVNLGLLLYLKYANFFLEALGQCLRAARLSPSLPALNVIVPVGISFYTFEAISYTVDVFRRRIPAERNLTHFLLFILFFPHLVAGPIVRARDFLPQARRHKHWSWPRFTLGGQLILLGLFKKLAIADRMALLVDPVFANPEAYGSAVLWMAAVAYAFQVYCDFSGYSDLALGTAHLLGYHLAINFNMPFAAPNMADFWKRWHISLSRWIRDYVFIPLGGSRGSTWQWVRNVLLAMTLCGLWHGPHWPYVAWGFLNGVYLLVHHVFRVWVQRHVRLDALLKTAAGTALRVGLTFLAFVLSVALFRSASLAASATMFQRMFSSHGGKASPVPALCLWGTALVMLLAHLVAWDGNMGRRWERFPSWAHGLGYAMLLIVTLCLAPMQSQVFLYFQF